MTSVHRVIQSNRTITFFGKAQTLLIPPNQIYKCQQQKVSTKRCNLISVVSLCAVFAIRHWDNLVSSSIHISFLASLSLLLWLCFGKASFPFESSAFYVPMLFARSKISIIKVAHSETKTDHLILFQIIFIIKL